MLDPHLLVDYLFQTAGVNIPMSVVHRFWDIKKNLACERWAVDSPASPEHIPVAIYGDACTVRGNIKVLGIFLSFPLWRAKSTRCSRWLVCALEEAKLWGTETLNAIFKRICSSMAGMWNGMCSWLVAVYSLWQNCEEIGYGINNVGIFHRLGLLWKTCVTDVIVKLALQMQQTYFGILTRAIGMNTTVPSSLRINWVEADAHVTWF